MIKKILALVSVIALLIALVPVAAFAESDTTDVSGTLGSYYTITAPASVGLGTLVNTNTTSSTNQTLSVETNDDAKTTVTINVQDAVNSGYLTSVPTSLSTALQLSGTGLTTTTLSGTDQPLITSASLSGTGVKTWSVSDLVIAQPAFTMVAAGTYTTTITFTAIFN